jgi:hypothetical protein
MSTTTARFAAVAWFKTVSIRLKKEASIVYGDPVWAWPLNRIGIRTWSKPRFAMNGKSSARTDPPQSPSFGASSRFPRLMPFLK